MNAVLKFCAAPALVWIVVNAGCSDESTGPSTPLAGVMGRVLDADGRPVPDAQLFLLYSYQYLPQDPPFSAASAATSTADSFAFALGQPFPNPVARSLYVRFSIPADGSVQVKLLDRTGSETLFSRSESVRAGWYQWHLPDVVPSLQLTNRIHAVQLRFIPASGGNPQTMSKNVLVVSAGGRPNAVADAGGRFFLPYSDFCVGDSTLTTSNDTQWTPMLLTSTSHVYVVAGDIKEIAAGLQAIPGVVVQRDIILGAKLP